MTREFAAETPGQLLREAREARGVSLETVHDCTKIPIRLLEALERDEYHKVSDELYVRSFLRSYSTWLGLDTEHVLSLFQVVAGDATFRKDPGAPVWTEDQVTVRRVGFHLPRLVRYGLAAAAFLILLAAAWRFWPGDQDEPDSSVRVTEELTDGSHGDMSPQRGGDATIRDGRHDPSPDEGSGPRPDGAHVRTRELPEILPGDPRLDFSGGRTFDLVLRVRLPLGANCTVSRDGQPTAMPVIWPEEPTALPASGIRHGVAYAVRDGHVVYWGANDNFVITPGTLQDVEVTLNGVAQSLLHWREGQPMVLDSTRLAATGAQP